jgi:hypothetical protein
MKSRGFIDIVNKGSSLLVAALEVLIASAEFLARKTSMSSNPFGNRRSSSSLPVMSRAAAFIAAFRLMKDREGARESMVFPERLRRRCRSRAFSDRATAKQSAMKLLGYDILHYGTGHGPCCEGRRPTRKQRSRGKRFMPKTTAAVKLGKPRCRRFPHRLISRPRASSSRSSSRAARLF